MVKELLKNNSELRDMIDKLTSKSEKDEIELYQF